MRPLCCWNLLCATFESGQINLTFSSSWMCVSLQGVHLTFLCFENQNYKLTAGAVKTNRTSSSPVHPLALNLNSSLLTVQRFFLVHIVVLLTKQRLSWSRGLKCLQAAVGEWQVCLLGLPLWSTSVLYLEQVFLDAFLIWEKNWLTGVK